jgi:hypothetical protein
MHVESNAERVVEVVTRQGRAKEGVIVSSGSEWTVMRVIDELRLDGWSCLRNDDITDVRDDEAHRFAERVIFSEPDARDAFREPKLPLDSTQSLLSTLSNQGLLTVRCSDGDFLLGEALEVTPDEVVVQAIGPQGAWYGHATKIALADVSAVGWGDWYARMFAKYAHPRPAPTGTVPRDTAALSR